MIFAKDFARNLEKNNTWSIRRLVDESFAQQSSISYCKLTDFWYGHDPNSGFDRTLL